MSKHFGNDLDKLTEQIIGCAMRIHKLLGPGFPEYTYENVLSDELRKSRLSISDQTTVKINYDGIEVGNQRADMIVEDAVVVELKNADAIEALYERQMQSYLNVSGKSTGMILNFGKDTLEVKKMVNKQ